MKKKAFCTLAYVLLVLSFISATGLPLFGQKDFNVDEKKLIDTFKRANPYYLDGAKQFAKGKLDKAETKLMECLEIMPAHADASYVLAQVHLKRKAFPEALAAIITAEKNYAANARFQNFSHQDYLDRLRQQREELETQRTQLERKIQTLGGNNPERGRLEQEVQSFVQSIREIDRRLNSPTDTSAEVPADYFYIHGNALFQLRRASEAAAQYQEAIRRDPRHGNAYNNLALVWFSMGKYREALDCLMQAEAAGVKVNPDFKKAVEAKVEPQ
jgi:tetratricopeptide (TPR) repeat protein